jgi:hypothetical protein
MPDIVFYHPAIRPSKDGSRPGPYLVVKGIDEISWGYTLNTSTYPTYGGEVVQVLSTRVDDLEIRGTVRNYAKQEAIYSYFAYYLQIATQGRSETTIAGETAFNQTPMTVVYYERNWNFKIIVKGLPGFRQGREVVAPEWRIQAHVVDDSEDLHSVKEFTQHKVLDDFLKSEGDSFDLTGRIGFIADNPFSSPGSVFGDTYDPTYTHEAWTKEADRFSEVINSYLKSDVDQIYETLASHPVYGNTAGEGTNQVEQGRKKVGG